MDGSPRSVWRTLSAIRDVRLFPLDDGRVVAIGSGDLDPLSLYVVDVGSGELLVHVPDYGFLHRYNQAVSMTSDGQLFAWHDGTFMTVVDVDSGAVVAKRAVPHHAVLSPNGRYVAAARHHDDVVDYDITTMGGAFVHRFTVPDDAVVEGEDIIRYEWAAPGVLAAWSLGAFRYDGGYWGGFIFELFGDTQRMPVVSDLS